MVARLRGDDRALPGVANIGVRPTVDGETRLLEVHLFDVNEDLYGKYMRVEFLSKLREERRFESLDELKAQIARDADDARAYLGHVDLNAR